MKQDSVILSLDFALFCVRSYKRPFSKCLDKDILCWVCKWDFPISCLFSNVFLRKIKLTVSFAPSSLFSSSRHVIWAGGRDPTDWHMRSYFLPAVTRLLFSKIVTSNGLTVNTERNKRIKIRPINYYWQGAQKGKVLKSSLIRTKSEGLKTNTRGGRALRSVILIRMDVGQSSTSTIIPNDWQFHNNTAKFRRQMDVWCSLWKYKLCHDERYTTNYRINKLHSLIH